MSTLTRRVPLTALCLLAVTGTALPVTTARAQPALSPEEVKAATAQRKAAARAREAEVFFSTMEPLAVTLTTNIRRIRGDKEDKAPWRPAVLSYTDGAGKQISIPTQIRTRGIWRLKNCEFPPLRLNFRNEDTKGTLLRGIDKPKLVSYCQNQDSYAHFITQEMQLYRIYSLLTPASHRARLLRVTYSDSASGKTHATRMAILLEEPEVMAARLGGDLAELKGATPDHLDAYHDALAAVFQYFIGNTDWSTFALHNMELVREADGDYRPIPYDFDFSGVINAPYATVDPKLSIDRVRQRLFRGFCRPTEDYEKAFVTFNKKKDAIYALYRDPIGSTLPKRTVDETLKYFDEFYQTINDSRRAKNQIADNCVKVH